MARTQQVKEKGNAHTTEYEKNTPVETQGFYVFFPAYEMRRDTSSRLRFLSVTYPKYAPVKKATRFLSGLHFWAAGRVCGASSHSCLSTLQKKIDFLLDSFYTIYRLAFYYERYTNERNKGILPFDLEK